MNSIQTTSSCQESKIVTIHDIPREIFGWIVSFFDNPSLWTMTEVSKPFSSVSIEETNLTRHSQTYSFIESIQDKLKTTDSTSNREAILALDTIKQRLKDEYPNLVARDPLEDLFLGAEGSSLIDVLKTLGNEELDRLKGIPCPGFFADIFTIAEIHRACLDLMEELDEEELQDMAFFLVQAGAINRAIELVNSKIASKDVTFHTLALERCRQGDIRGALKIVRSISKERFQNMTLSGIAEALGREGKIDTLIQLIMNNVQDPSEQYVMLRKEVTKRITEKDLKSAEKIANSIPNSQLKEEALQLIKRFGG